MTKIGNGNELNFIMNKKGPAVTSGFEESGGWFNGPQFNVDRSTIIRDERCPSFVCLFHLFIYEYEIEPFLFKYCSIIFCNPLQMYFLSFLFFVVAIKMKKQVTYLQRTN